MQGGIVLFFAGACTGIWAHKQALEGGMFSIVWSSQWRAEFAFGKQSRAYTQARARTYVRTYNTHLVFKRTPLCFPMAHWGSRREYTRAHAHTHTCIHFDMHQFKVTRWSWRVLWLCKWSYFFPQRISALAYGWLWCHSSMLVISINFAIRLLRRRPLPIRFCTRLCSLVLLLLPLHLSGIGALNYVLVYDCLPKFGVWDMCMHAFMLGCLLY